ncbi:3-hydroxyacyl-CoA dehydrogenase NAD-binding domain-containing protein [Castellaniella sp.]|uniref:3-hydroxyacyl-CoA dehydrogenase NAD-binding domain-containing protein n=1 Tax=Castellaniella sp. TaxID=1955812 RepID=UPI002AFDCBD7|nr:3-hydroxyacyl-CoA dehydrogenase NAD-binding domain-containing protein [Castellaniella sp.]
MNGCVRTEIEDDILIIVIDHPPVNACSTPVRRGLLDAIGQLAGAPELRAGVLIGAGRQFVVGADIKEFDRPPQSPALFEVANAFESCAKPIVAALHGAALGGGLELGLACDARVAEADCLLGLPEVGLGLIPGAGGTQRLPRLVGPVHAIRIIGGSERLRAAQAVEIGLVDKLAGTSLRADAIEYARALEGRKRCTRDRQVPVEKAADIEAAARSVRRAGGKERPAVLAAVEAIGLSMHLPFEDALARERTLFLQLRHSDEAAALRHQFFAERNASKLSLPPQARVRPVSIVAIIGAGTMGAGISISALDAGLKVILLEQDDAALERGLGRLRDHYANRTASGKISAELAERVLDRLEPTTDWSRIAPADLIIEAVFEDMDAKRAVFALIDRHARPGAVLASNTSYLDVDVIARTTSRPGDVLGLHFFSPAHVMKLVEIVRGAETAPSVLATAMQLARALDKQAVVTGNAFGFIGNRIYNAYRRHCEFMLEDGAWPEEIDAALEDFGFAMGPFAVADLSGLDIAWRMRRAQAARRHPDERYVPILDRLCEQGRFGRKAGRGYYTYEDGKRSQASDQTVRATIEAASAERGIERRALNAEEIQRRALAAMANEAACLLAEGVAARASDVDVVLVRGYGFPRWRGGPIFEAWRLGATAWEQSMDELASIEGPRFVRGDFSVLFDKTEQATH